MKLTSLAPGRVRKGKKQTQWTVQNPSQWTIRLPCTEKQQQTKTKTSPLYRRKTFPVTVRLPCTEGKKKLSVDSPSPLYRRKKPSQWTVRHRRKERRKRRGKKKQNKTSNWTFARKKNFPRTEEEIRLSGQFKPFAVYTDCIYSSYTEEKRTLLRGQLKPVPCGQSVSLIVVRGKKLFF